MYCNDLKVEIPDFPNREHWFQPNISLELAKVKSIINSIEASNIKDILLCAFSKIIVKVSNQDSEVRYTQKNKNHPDGIVFNEMIKTPLEYIISLDENINRICANTKIFNGDSLTEIRKISDNSLDFVITSPPYINTFDYYLYHK